VHVYNCLLILAQLGELIAQLVKTVCLYVLTKVTQMTIIL